MIFDEATSALDPETERTLLKNLLGAGWGHGVGLCQIGAAVMRKKKHIVAWNQKAVGSEKAIPARAAPMSACIVNTHQRLKR